MTVRKPKPGGAAGKAPKKAPSKAGREPNGRFAAGNRLNPFPPGNKLWKSRATHSGPALKMPNPEILWASCLEYLEWNEANPLWEMKAFAHQGIVVQKPMPKMRAMTIGAMCVFLDITHETWITWRQTRADLQPVIKQVEAIIYAQKFEGASADLLNAAIIARELGLADKREVSGPDGEPIITRIVIEAATNGDGEDKAAT